MSRWLLSRIPSLERVLGVLVVRAVCHEALNILAPELDKLLTRDLHSDLKQMVIGYKHIHERPVGWLGLYDVLRTEP